MDTSPDHFTLHPDYITDVVEDLLDKDIISKKELSNLKNDRLALNLDPALVMDLRHMQKRKNIMANKCEKENNSKHSLRNHKTLFIGSMNTAVKDLNTIDKEIAMTKRELKKLNDQITKNEDVINSSVFAIAEERKEVLNNSEPVNIYENEVKKHFEMHLDSLENKIQSYKNYPDAKKQMWTPLQVECSPIINGDTYKENATSDQQEFEFDVEELSILKQFEMNLISVIGKPVDQVSIRDKVRNEQEHTTTETPHCSPEYKRDLMKCTFRHDNCVPSMEIKIARTTIEKWKDYVNQRKVKRFCNGMKNKTINYLLKKVLMNWNSYTKDVKLFKNATMKRMQSNVGLENISQVESERCALDKGEVSDESIPQKLKENGQKDKKESNNLKHIVEDNIQDDCFQTNHLEVYSKTYKGTTTCMIENDSIAGSNNKDEKTNSNDAKNEKQLRHGSYTRNICCKILTPEFVGMSSEMEKPNLPGKKSKMLIKEDKEHHTNFRNLTKTSGEFHFRYIAQEKIIVQQLAVIERQKKIIFDLQAENIVTKSALQKITVDTQLKIENMKRQKCLMIYNSKTDAEKDKLHVKSTSFADKSQELANRMLSRHEYGKHLAELTKNRKKRIEEEKARVKSELEERQKIEKEEKIKQSQKKIKLEKVLAERSSKLHIAKIKKMNTLTESAVAHYNKIIQRKVFQKLKQSRLETQQEIDKCILICQKRLLKRAFCLLKTNAKNAQIIKCETAEKFYKDKLIERYWCYWHQLYQEYKIKIQVSVDMFESSLQRRMFYKLQDYMSQQNIQKSYKTEAADRLYTRKLLMQCLKRWRELPRLMMTKREHEMRLSAWRRTVQEVIPDFKPV